LFFSSVYEFAFAYAYYTLFFSLLVVISAYDLRHKIIPDAVSLMLAGVSFIGLFFFEPVISFVPYFHVPSLLSFLAGPLLALPFALLWLVSRGRWMGLGDAKLAVSLGWLLGLQAGFSALAVSFWIGSAVGILLLIFTKKYKMRTEIPFAPYLALGAFIAFILELHLFLI
jgi:prepilin signal peptidase PulO-like enzyme (type II secretory pathway)